MINLKIRQATLDDIEALVLLENSFSSEIYSKEELIKMMGLNYYKFLIAEIDNKVVGYLCATIIFDDCDILKIIVNQNFQRQGVGRNLIYELNNICVHQDTKKIHLEVSVKNTKAISFYENLGFEYICTREKYYDGVDAKIYEMSVK